ncbi:MAG: hypothetical protein C0434_01035 [Xanthomonadaceae bacterium]|nr:hypothetical protein [Xanthomonadaceae bacterium]
MLPRSLGAADIAGPPITAPPAFSSFNSQAIDRCKFSGLRGCASSIRLHGDGLNHATPYRICEAVDPSSRG